LRGKRSGAAWLYALSAIVLLQLLAYPALATALYRAFTGSGWDGSALGYFQRYRIAPAALIFGGFILVPAIRASSRGRPIPAVWIVSLWVLNLALLGLSVAGYARLVH
jgi:hypothetical protein